MATRRIKRRRHDRPTSPPHRSAGLRRAYGPRFDRSGGGAGRPTCRLSSASARPTTSYGTRSRSAITATTRSRPLRCFGTATDSATRRRRCSWRCCARSGIPCRLHGFTIHKALQRGVVPEIAYRHRAREHPAFLGRARKGWDLGEPRRVHPRRAVPVGALQAAFAGRASLCAYGAGTDFLADPPVVWTGGDTYIQRTGHQPRPRALRRPGRLLCRARPAFATDSDPSGWMNA